MRRCVVLGKSIAPDRVVVVRRYAGPAMTFEARYAFVAKTVVISTLFSAGAPLLNWVALVALASQCRLARNSDEARLR